MIIVVSTADKEYVIADHLGFGRDDMPAFTDWLVTETAGVREELSGLDFDFATCA
jgi:hypothetical protein